jgi:Alpha/beta hydrolase domain
MTRRSSWWWRGFVAVLAVAVVGCSGGVSPVGGRGGGGEAPGAGSRPARWQTPAMPEVEGPVTEPGDPYLDPLELNFPADASAAASGYVFEEYLVSGTAADQPYRVRVQVTRPGDEAEVDFSGHAIVEAIHPQGIPFVWNFTRDLLMAEGHAAVNISVFPNTVETLKGANPGRYETLQAAADGGNQNSGISFPHASDIYAQVARWLKSRHTPLPGVRWLHMTGHSMSVGPVWQYMDTHHDRWRLHRGAPLYDGFFPETTRTASRMGPFPRVDVPTLLINSELEVEEVLVRDGINYRRPDSNRRGHQFRLYEVAGLPHNPSWMHPLLRDVLDIETLARERCVNPLNSFPYNPTIGMALDHLLRWVEDHVPPPRADRIELTGEPGQPGTAIRRDGHGNALGGVRSTTLDVPIATHQALNHPRDPAQELTPGSCLVYGSQLDFAPDELTSLYGDRDSYVDEVDERLDELVDDGWFLDRYADDILAQASAAPFPG